MSLILTISTFFVLGLLVFLLRRKITGYLLYLRGRIQMGSIRRAIKEADDDKSKTGRKNMVVFNRSNGSFEPIQKRVLKVVSNSRKQKNNAKQTNGRKRFAKPIQPRTLTPQQVKRVEKKSIYVTS